jgi:ice-binding like protein
MFTYHHSRLAAGLLVATALLGAACSDATSSGPASSNPTSSINVTPSYSRSSHGGSGGSGASAGFSVLANAAVTCTGGSITGDVGTFQTAPPGAITLTEGCLISGAQDIGGSAAKAAYQGFLDQYAALAPKVGDVCPVITGTLAGQSLTPGVYCVSSEAKTGVLTLSGGANATWLIKVPSGALTGTNFSVVLAGGAQACNVTWWVDAAATMTTSAFQGNILAGAAITTTGGTFNGNAWAGAAGVGDVTFTGTAVVGCGSGNGDGDDDDHGKGHKDKDKCNQGVGNGPEGCDPGDSNHHHGSNDEDGGRPGHPGRRGGH